MHNNNNFNFISLRQRLDVTNIISLFHYKYPLHFVFDGETHDFWEFIYVDQGILEITASNDVFILKEGEIIFHQPNEFHALRTCSNKPTSAIICSFTCDHSDMNFFKRYRSMLLSKERTMLLELLFLRSHLFFNDSVPFHSTPKPIEQIPVYYLQSVKNYIELFLMNILARNYNNIQSDNSNEAKFHSLTQNVIIYLNQNINKKLTLEEISVAVGYSVPHMKRLFHQDMKQGIIDYFIKLKIDEAKKMINNGNNSLSEIANILDFNDLAYFCRKFKQYEGMTPSEFKHSL